MAGLRQSISRVQGLGSAGCLCGQICAHDGPDVLPLVQPSNIFEIQLVVGYIMTRIKLHCALISIHQHLHSLRIQMMLDLPFSLLYLFLKLPLFLRLMINYELQLDICGIVVFPIFEQLVQEVDSFFDPEFLGPGAGFESHVVGFLGSEDELDVGEIVPVDVDLGDAAQFGVEGEHAECDILLRGYSKSLIYMVGLLFGCENAEVGSAHIHNDHSKICLTDHLEAVVHAFPPQLVYQLNWIHCIQLVCPDAGDVVYIVGFLQLGQELRDLALHVLQIDSVIPILSAYVNERIPMISGSRSRQSLMPGWRRLLRMWRRGGDRGQFLPSTNTNSMRW